MAYRTKKDKLIEEAIASMPSIDLEVAEKELERGGDGVALGFPEGWQWIVAMHEAHKRLQVLEVRRLRLESVLLSFKKFFEDGFAWPTSAEKVDAPQRQRHSSKAQMGRPLVEVNMERARQLVSSGLSCRKAAKLLGIHHNTLNRRLKQDHSQEL